MQKNLSTRASDRIESVNKVQFEYEHPMTLFKKMIHESEKKGNKEAIYPHKLQKISKQLYDGARHTMAAYRNLALDYSQYSADTKFVREYNDRIEYIEVMHNELKEAMQDLVQVLAHSPAYHDGLKNGEEKLKTLYQNFDETKKIMQEVVVANEKLEHSEEEKFQTKRESLIIKK